MSDKFSNKNDSLSRVKASRPRTLNRRGFLKNVGKAGLTTALLKSSMLSSGLLWGPSAFAADAPKRVVFVYVPGGAIPSEWHPTGSETNFTLPAMSAPLEAVKDQCIFLNGVDMNNPGHGLTSKALAGDRNFSLDIFLGNTLGANSPFSLLQLGVISNGFGSTTRLNFSEPAYEDNPFNAFQRLFGNAGGGGSQDIATQQTRSVLDINKEALTRLRSRLGSFERERLDQHTAAIEKIESRLLQAGSGGGGGACSSPAFNPGNFNGNPSSDLNFDAVSTLQMDLITLALKCDLTRVVSFMLGNHQSDFFIPDALQNTQYHQSIHGRPAVDYITFRRYFSERLAYLIKSLAEAEDLDGGSVLDNTIILQVTDMADGRSHTGGSAPFMMAGGGGGSLRRGRSLNFNGADYRKTLDTVAVAAGIDIERPDYPAYGNGPLSGVLS